MLLLIMRQRKGYILLFQTIQYLEVCGEKKITNDVDNNEPQKVNVPDTPTEPNFFSQIYSIFFETKKEETIKNNDQIQEENNTIIINEDPIQIEEIVIEERIGEKPTLIQNAISTSSIPIDSIHPKYYDIDEIRVKQWDKDRTTTVNILTDDDFIAAFETCDINLDEIWNHLALLRMIWLYLTKFGRRDALAKIFDGYKVFNENRKTQVGVYHMTVIYFWIQIVDYCLLCDKHVKEIAPDFTEFLNKHVFLKNNELFLQYYSVNLIFHNLESMNEFVLPDIKPLPSIVSF